MIRAERKRYQTRNKRKERKKDILQVVITYPHTIELTLASSRSYSCHQAIGLHNLESATLILSTLGLYIRPYH